MRVPLRLADAPSALLVPFASTAAPETAALTRGLALPHLTDLLTCLQPATTWGADEWSFTPPHERALADAMGLAGDDGALPWAALESGWQTEPQAWFHPVHLQVGMDHVSLQQASWLDEVRSRALFDALAPLCREDGVELEFTSAHRWRARGERLRGLSCASLDRVTGRSMAAWQPRGPESSWLRRLQSEAQMLFYTHPANEALEAAGLAPVNGFWADSPGAVIGSVKPSRAPVVHDDLRAPALQGDWTNWARAWEALDATVMAACLQALRRNEPVDLILCGERRAVHLAPRPRSWLGWTRRLRRTEHPVSFLETL